MCGKAVPYRPTLSIDWRLCLRAAPAQGVAFRRNLGGALAEGQSPSAHQAAEPQEKPLVSSCVDTNGAGVPPAPRPLYSIPGRRDS
jgi:hypothetical protein